LGPRACERRVIIRPSGPVHPATPAVSPGEVDYVVVCSHGQETENQGFSAPFEGGPVRTVARQNQSGVQSPRPLAERGALIRRLRRHSWRREFCRNLTASGSGRRPGSARNRKVSSFRWPACRRSGTACLLRFSVFPAVQLAFNHPNRIGKPSPPSKVSDS